MMRDIKRRVLSFGFCVLVFGFGLISKVHADWLIAKGYFCTLYIRPDVDIEALNKRLDTYKVDFGLSQKPARPGQAPQDEVLYKFDLVFLKVQELLDMRPRGLHLTARLYKTKGEIERVYMELFNEQGKFVAFYVFRLNTLFACEEKVSAGIIAHEMAHCIIDHHFTVPPPKKIGEMLAHYAELHLRE